MTKNSVSCEFFDRYVTFNFITQPLTQTCWYYSLAKYGRKIATKYNETVENKTASTTEVKEQFVAWSFLSHIHITIFRSWDRQSLWFFGCYRNSANEKGKTKINSAYRGIAMISHIPCRPRAFPKKKKKENGRKASF